jgi:Copper transport outer membrane protein, MctB
VISFRYHVASLLAVLLALAAGVALGAGPLDDGDSASAPTGPRAATPGGTSDQSSFADDFDASLTSTLTDGRLNGRSVAVVILPGADQATVSSLIKLLGTAGATVTSTTTLSADLVDPTNKQLVDELGSQLEQAATKVTIAADAGVYDRMGALLGYAVASRTAGGDTVDSQGKNILAGLSTASLVTTGDQPNRRGSMILAIAGAPQGSVSDATAASGVELSLLKALDGQARGTVLAGPLQAAGEGGSIAALRNDADVSKVVSTVDSADLPAGQIVSVLALAEQAAGKSGQYGAGAGVSGPRPGVSAAKQ